MKRIFIAFASLSFLSLVSISPIFFRQTHDFWLKIRRSISPTFLQLHLLNLWPKNDLKFAKPVSRLPIFLSEKAAQKCWWNRPLVDVVAQILLKPIYIFIYKFHITDLHSQRPGCHFKYLQCFTLSPFPCKRGGTKHIVGYVHKCPNTQLINYDSVSESLLRALN